MKEDVPWPTSGVEKRVPCEFTYFPSPLSIIKRWRLSACEDRSPQIADFWLMNCVPERKWGWPRRVLVGGSCCVEKNESLSASWFWYIVFFILQVLQQPRFWNSLDQTILRPRLLLLWFNSSLTSPALFFSWCQWRLCSAALDLLEESSEQNFDLQGARQWSLDDLMDVFSGYEPLKTYRGGLVSPHWILCDLLHGRFATRNIAHKLGQIQVAWSRSDIRHYHDQKVRQMETVSDWWRWFGPRPPVKKNIESICSRFPKVSTWNTKDLKFSTHLMILKSLWKEMVSAMLQSHLLENQLSCQHGGVGKKWRPVARAFSAR